MPDQLVRRSLPGVAWLAACLGCRVNDMDPDPYEQETAALERLVSGLEESLALMPDESPDWKALVWRFRASVLVALSQRQLRPVSPPAERQPHSEAERLHRVV